MPAKSQEALDRKRKRNLERDMIRRQAYQDNQQASIHIHLPRQHHIDHKTDLSLFDKIEYKTVGEATNNQCRANITLADQATEAIILQRVGPTSYAKRLKANQSALRGKLLYNAYLSKKDPEWMIQQHSSSKHQLKITKRKVVEHHLGIWHSQAKAWLDFTKETTNHRYKQEALDLLAWAKQHMELVLIKSAKETIHPNFDHNLKTRAKGQRWLASIFGKKSIGLLHPFSTTLAFFSDFAGGIHLDQQDCIPSFLFNFGDSAWVELPEYSVKVLLKPLEMPILNSRTFYHRTRPVEASLFKPGSRWAFSAFFREGIYNRETVCQIAEWRLDAIFGKAKG